MKGLVLQAIRPEDALGDDRVFPMTAWNAWDRVRLQLPKAGLELVSPHSLRHSHGTHCPSSRRRPRHGPRDARARVARDHRGRYLHARPEKSDTPSR